MNQYEHYVAFNGLEDNQERFNAYYYPDSYVLRNLLEIRDEKLLQRQEIILVNGNYKKAKKIKGAFDFEHLKAIHKALFGNLYSWAGKVRQCDMGKTKLSRFFHYNDIEVHAKFVFSYVQNTSLKELSKEKVAIKLCDIYLAINELHPFRDGNGRTLNEFIRQFAEKNGYILDIQKSFNEYKTNGINYYQWFEEYNQTKNSEPILNNLFLAILKKIGK